MTLPYELQKEHVQKMLRSPEGTSARLLWGNKGIGKKQFALEAAHALASHPCDIDVLEMEGNKTIGIDRVREAVENIYITPLGQRRILVLIDADTALTERSMSVLLKVFEEPPRSTKFILTAQRPGLLPATILSRCLRIQCPMPPGDIESQYKNTILEISHGSIGHAEALRTAGIEEAYEKVLTLIHSPAPWSRQTILSAAEALKDPAITGTLCEHILHGACCLAASIPIDASDKEKVAWNAYIKRSSPLKRLPQADRLLRQVIEETRTLALEPKQACIRMLMCLELPIKT